MAWRLSQEEARPAHGWGVAWIGRAMARVMLLVGATWRVRVEGAEHESAARAGGGRVIYALWHGRIMALAWAWRDRGIRALVIRHRDGEALALALERLGYIVTRGSSRRGGAEALLSLMAEARRGDLAITPDGPRGPAGALSPGVLVLAQRTGLPILPVSCTASSAWQFGTWDRFLFPHPFARVTIRVGEPIRVAAESDPGQVKALGLELAGSLMRLSQDGPDGAGPP